MARIPILSFDRGTLILHPPPRGKDWVDFVTWDDRIEKFRIPAIQYRDVVQALNRGEASFNDKARNYKTLALPTDKLRSPYPHQAEALNAWKTAGGQGVVVLPTAAGKTHLALMAIQTTGRSVLVMVPTLDLMHQWYAQLLEVFPDAEVGLLGGGSRDRTPILVATYDSAAIHAETLGNLYGLLVFDECHHLPSDFNRVIAEYSIAPFRLGLTATPDRGDDRHQDLDWLIGKQIYHKTPEELSGGVLAKHEHVKIQVTLSDQERDRYDQLIQTRNAFLRSNNIFLGSLKGWQNFVRQSARSQAGRKAMKAHRAARAIAFGTDGKLRVLSELLAEHYPAQTLIFTDDNATVYRISQDFLIPAITHQTPVKERHSILAQFKSGVYPTLVTSRVLNEGVDVPEARIAIILSGTGTKRESVQRLGRVLRKGQTPDKVAILYEVIAVGTSEEHVSKRRNAKSEKQSERDRRQLTLVPPVAIASPRAAESSPQWNTDDPEF